MAFECEHNGMGVFLCQLVQRLLRARFHVSVMVHLKINKWVEGWKKGGDLCPSPLPKDRYPTWMGVPHHMLCKNGAKGLAVLMVKRRTCTG